MRSEFEFIRYIKDRYGFNHLGDDCAVLPKDSETDLVVTVDMLVEGIDFRLDWTTPEFLGHKALAVSLSDIAAMGARPDWAMLSIGVPPGLWGDHFLDMFYAGWHGLAAEHGVELVGGDVSRAPDGFVIDSIVGGSVPKGRAILRSGAQPGDAIYVTGPLGGAAAGLKLLLGGTRIGAAMDEKDLPLILKQLRPYPQLEAAQYLQSNSIATAMIDISDGLSSDLEHLAEASGVGARLLAGSVPLANPDAVDPAEALDDALHGGEDFELLFTVDMTRVKKEQLANFRHIGEINGARGIVELTDPSGSHMLQPKGYRHF